MISFCGNWVSRPLACTASRFCHKLSERALFLSCSCNTGGDMTADPAPTVPAVTPGERFSRCRLCSISCCLEVSRYSWYRKSGGSKKKMSQALGVQVEFLFAFLKRLGLPLCLSTILKTLLGLTVLERSCHTSGLASLPLACVKYLPYGFQQQGSAL